MSKYTKFGRQRASGILLVGFEVALGADQKVLWRHNDKDDDEWMMWRHCNLIRVSNYSIKRPLTTREKGNRVGFGSTSYVTLWFLRGSFLEGRSDTSCSPMCINQSLLTGNTRQEGQILRGSTREVKPNFEDKMFNLLPDTSQPLTGTVITR